MKKYSFLLITALLFCISCSGRQEYNPFDAKICYVTPDVTDTIYGTPVCTLSTDENPMEYVLSAVYDSLLILKMYNNERLISIINLKTGKKLGDFINKGKGPGEMLSISLNKCYEKNDSVFAVAYDMTGQGNFAEINVTEMVSSGKVSIRQIGKVVPVTFKAQELNDTVNMYLRIDDNFLKLQEIDKSGTRLVKSYNLFPDILATHVAIMSCIFQVNKDNTKVAVIMSNFPELNFIDLSTDERSSVVYRDKLNFEEIFENFRLNTKYPNSSQENSVISNNGDIILLDKHVDQNWDVRCMEFLVFDWDGNFKCRLTLNERCGFGVFDSENKLLYAVTEDDVLYRYDLSKYFPEESR